MRKAIDFMKTHPFFTGFFGVSLCVAAIKLFNPDGRLFAMALFRVVLTFAMSMFVYLISGAKSFEKCHTTTGYILKWGLLMIITSAAFGLLMLVGILTGATPTVSDWPVRLAGAACLFFVVGFVEEITFRVLINDSLLYAFRNSKHVFVWIAIIGSLVFGGVHVIGADVFSSPLTMATAALKTVSTAIFGFSLLVLYWKTRNIFGIALVHAIYDFLSGGIGLLTSETTKVGGASSYVDVGAIGSILYAVMIIVDSIVATVIWKKVGKTIDFEEIRRTW